MAFGKKYYSSYKSNNNLDYYLEIFVEDYSSTSSELTMGAGGPVIEYETDQEDRFSPIISSSCKIPFLVKDNIDATFIDSLRTTYQERQIYVHLYRSDSSGYSSVSPLWSGFLVMDLGKGVDKSFPYVQELKFVDGLALLKDIDFVDLSNPTYEDRVQGNYVQENMYYGPGTYIFWIREILLKSGAALTTQGATENYRFTTSINWYNGDMDSAGQSDDPLQKTKCQVSMFHRKDDKDVYFPDNCYNVLKELLRHWGARITYWKHQFWIVQIPEYITGESGTLDNPQNNNSRVYTYTGSLQGTQDHLGSTYWTRYFQEISNTKISKLTGTTYDYLPILKQVNADFLSFASENKFGGLPFGSTAPTQEVFQGTINTPSAADYLFLSIPLDWQWDLSSAPNFPSGHTNGWWASIKFNFYASDGSTTYYLQYNSQSQTLPYFWVDSANWSPLGNRSPKYTISSKQITVNGHVGFEEQIPFQDENGNPIVMSGAWSFFLDIEDYGTSSSNPGSFYLNISPSSQFARMRNPGTAIQVPPGSGNMSGTISWSNSLQDPQGIVTISSIQNPAGFNAGTVANDIRFATTSPFLGLLQLMTNSQSAAYGESYNTMNTSSTAAQENSEQFNFGTLLWGDVTDEFARSSLQVFDGSTYENTNQSGLWGRGTLLGTKTFTQLLIDEFLYGQTKIVITPNMRLAVGEANKDETVVGVTRPRYVNPIGKLRETRDGADPEYFFRRGSFHTLLDEWDYEGYQILRNVVTTTTQTNGMGNKGGTQANSPNQQAMIQNPVVQALAQNSPIAYLRETVNATGSDVAVNGNFNVATGWTLGTGWTIDTTEKVAKFAATGSTSDLVQSVLTQELTYQVNFRVVVTAGTLTVKAGTSGDTQVISSSGDYSIYLTCEGSNDIKFQAGTTFTGNITFITLRDQKSLTSLPIEEIGSAVFKTGDTFNLINENQDEPLVLTVTANQGSTDTTISVSSTPLYEDITPNSYLLINQDDLSAQYQNKTKGTVGGFDITANSIDSGSVSIQSYIDDDTFSTASATSLATSESIKAYVDTQVGSADTLQEVTNLGNTTTNSIRIGSSSAPAGGVGLHVDSEIRVDGNDGVATKKIRSSYFSSSQNITIESGSSAAIVHNIGSSEKMRLTSTGLGIGTSSPEALLTIKGDAITTSQPVRITNSVQDTHTALFINNIGGTIGEKYGLQFGGYNEYSIGGIFGVLDSTSGSTSGDITIDFPNGTSAGSLIEKVRFTHEGNVLIGVTSGSTARLQSIAADGNSSSLRIGRADSSNFWEFNHAGNDLRIYNEATSGSNILLGVDAGGNSESNNVGIKTDNPTSPLQVDGTIFINGSTLKVTRQSVTNYYDSNAMNSYGSFYDWEFSNSKVMRINSSGKLLLGTTSDIGGELQVFSGDAILTLKGNNASYINAATQLISGHASTARGMGTFAYCEDSDVEWFWGNPYNGNDAFVINRNSGYTVPSSQSSPPGIGSSQGTVFTINSSGNVTTGALTLSSTVDQILILKSTDDGPVYQSYYRGSDRHAYLGFGGSSDNFNIVNEESSGAITFGTNGSEKMRLTTTGLGIGVSSPSQGLHVVDSGIIVSEFESSNNGSSLIEVSNNAGLDAFFGIYGGNLVLRLDDYTANHFSMNSSGDVTLSGSLTGTTATFSDQVTIPATPVASTDAASKGYVDAQVGSADTLSEVLALGNTSGSNDIAMDLGQKVYFNNQNENIFSNVNGDLQINARTELRIKANSNNDNFTELGFWNGDSEKMRLLNNGNLLIGTTSDSGFKLRVNGDSTTGVVAFKNAVNGRDTLRSENAGGTRTFNVGNDGSGHGILLLRNSSGTTTSYLSGSGDSYFNGGNVLIGTTTDAGYKLDVSGSFRASQESTFASNLLFPDNSRIKLGNSNDLQIYHNGTNTIMTNGTGEFRIIQSKSDADLVLMCDDGTGGETAYLTLDGSQTTINLQQNVLIGTTSNSGGKLYVNSTTTDRVARFESSDSLAYLQVNDNQDSLYISTENQIGSFGGLTGSNSINFNISLTSGNAALGGTPSAVYKLDVVGKQRVQSVLELEDVLTLNAISTPSDPANNKSSIYMDSADGSIKVKINVEGTVVTRTLASFE